MPLGSVNASVRHIISRHENADDDDSASTTRGDDARAFLKRKGWHWICDLNPRPFNMETREKSHCLHRLACFKKKRASSGFCLRNPGPSLARQMNHGEVTDVICGDFGRAFDFVPRALLIEPRINRPPPPARRHWVGRGRGLPCLLQKSSQRPSRSRGAPGGGRCRPRAAGGGSGE